MRAQRIVEAYLHLISTSAEKEVERFLKSFLPGTEFAGKLKAVGGYVRDEYLSLIKNDPSIESKDLDIVVNMRDGAEKVTNFIYDTFNKKTLWDKVKELFSGTSNNPVSKPRQLGKGYPIWQITFKKDITYKSEKYHTRGAVIEFADTMKEVFPDPSSRQRQTLPADLKEDIERRDFTVNMLLKDMTTGEIEDATGVSKEDIAKGILRGHPGVSLDKIFNDDPLRMLRLIRFQAKYGWDIPRSVLKTVKRNADRIEIISSERIKEELEKIMKLGKLKKAVKIMSATGLLKHVLPEVEALKGVKQPEKHHSEGDVYRHTLMVLDNTKPGIESQLAALLHDIGKPKTQDLLEDKITFYGHDDVGSEIAAAILKRLKFDNKTIDKVKKMVKYHMRAHRIGDKPSVKTLRKFVRDVGEETIDAVLDLSRADELGRIPSSENIPDLRKKIEEARKLPIKAEPVLDGKEIMKLLGLKSGPDVGKAKKLLTDIADDYAEKGKRLTKSRAKKELLKQFGGKKTLASNLRIIAYNLIDNTP